MNGYIALDVGGTGIKASLVSEHGDLLIPITHYESKSTYSKEVILDNLHNIIIEQLKLYNKSIHILGVGLGFPGPFDYKNGICLIKGINKYDSIYEVNLVYELSNSLKKDNYFMLYASPSFSIHFENDARLYALGEMILQPNIPDKCICFCIGTGLGSAFLDNGQVITHAENIPANGWVYDTPFKDSIVDDSISVRGILKLYKDLSDYESTNVKFIADLALSGDKLALQTFNQFGLNFCEAITPFLKQFNPNTIILGGQICKSFNLFKAGFHKLLPPQFDSLEIKLSSDTSLSTLLGVVRLFNTPSNSN